LFQENQDVVHVSEFIKFNVCGRLIQEAAKRPRAFFTSAEKERQGENARINAYQKDHRDRENKELVEVHVDVTELITIVDSYGDRRYKRPITIKNK